MSVVKCHTVRVTVCHCTVRSRAEGSANGRAAANQWASNAGSLSDSGVQYHDTTLKADSQCKQIDGL
jgi:hypothetical protein